MSKISCFFPHPLPALLRGEDLNAALPGSLSQWVRFTRKVQRRDKLPIHLKADASLPRVFRVLSLSCNDTVGCLGLQTCQDKPTMGSVRVQYQGKEYIQHS